MKTLYTIFTLAVLLLCSDAGLASPVKGKVYGISDNGKDPLDAAVVKWINTTKGTITDEKGTFELSDENITDRRLVASYSGFKTDTVDAGSHAFIEIVLVPNASTEVIDVEGKQNSTYFEAVTAKTEVITSNELVKEACCDLSGCFGRNSSVEVAVTDILTDSKELKILGLEGVYTQILTDNLPVFSGLNVKYGVSSIPGTLIDKITVSKGSNSVLHGYESISGIMNVILRDYDNSDKLLVNAFLNSMLEKQFNMNFTENAGKYWSTIASFHSAQKSNPMDENGDTFLDNPLTTRYVGYNKWKFGDKKSGTDFNIAARYWNEEREGGQDISGSHSSDSPEEVPYEQNLGINSFEAYSRFSKSISKTNSMKLYLSGSYYDQESLYGGTVYNGRQSNFNAMGFYEFELADMNFLKTGLSYRFSDINENIRFIHHTAKNYAGDYPEIESIPGIFAEHSVNFLSNLATLSTGVRYDYHNEYGSVFTPRILVRYQPDLDLVFRASAGTGFRVARIFSENPNILASSRYVIVAEELKPEKVLNFGADMLYYFQLGSVTGSLNLDYYHTTFSNKIIPDYDVSPRLVVFSNLDGAAHSNVFQAEASLNIIKNIDLKLAYKYIDSEYELRGVNYEQPFNSKDRLVATFYFAPADDSYGISSSLHWYGKQRLPTTEANPVEYRRPLESEPYTVINLQANKNFSFMELYGGIENLLDFKQDNPIIAADDPYGPYFDTSFIWGPTKGREFYMGIRLLFN